MRRVSSRPGAAVSPQLDADRSDAALRRVSRLGKRHDLGEELLRLAFEQEVGRERLDRGDRAGVGGGGGADDGHQRQSLDEPGWFRQDLVGLNQLPAWVVEVWEG